jgi:hypothetical protein
MDTILKVINYIQDYINSVPAASWFALGSFIGTSAIGVGIVAWINRHHLKQTGEKLGRIFVTLNVAFWSAIMTTTSFVITAGPHFAAFLPFFGTHWPQLIGLMTLLYNIAKPSLEWWKARQDGKKFTSRMPELTPLVDQVTSPVIND